MRHIANLLLGAALLAAAAQVRAQNLTVSAADNAKSVAAAYKGKRITLRLRSGQELSGIVRDATDRLVVLGELSGREFFDAAVPVEAVEAVIVRTRQ